MEGDGTILLSSGETFSINAHQTAWLANILGAKELAQFFQVATVDGRVVHINKDQVAALIYHDPTQAEFIAKDPQEPGRA